MSPFDFGKNFLEEQVLVSKNLEQRVISQNFTIEELFSYLDLLAKGLNEPEILAFIAEVDKLDLPSHIKEHAKQLLLQHHQTKVMNKVGSSLSSQAEPLKDSEVHVYDEWVDDDRAYDIGDWYENRTFSPVVEESVVGQDNGIVRLSEDLSEFSQDPKDSPSSYTPSYEGIQVVLPDTELADELGISKYNVDKTLSQDTFPYQYVASIIGKLKKKSTEQRQNKEILNESEVSVLHSQEIGESEEKSSLEIVEDIKKQELSNPSESSIGYQGIEENLPIALDQDEEAREIVNEIQEPSTIQEDIFPGRLSEPPLKEEEVHETPVPQDPLLEEQEKTNINESDLFLKEEENVYSYSAPLEEKVNKQEDYVMDEKKIPIEQNSKILEVKEDDNAVAQVTDLRDDTEVPPQREYKEIMEEDLDRLNTMSFDTPSSLSQKKTEGKEDLGEFEDFSPENMEKISELSKHLEEEVYIPDRDNRQTQNTISAPTDEKMITTTHSKKYWWEDIPAIEYEATQDFGVFVLYRDLG